jgi:hypothetical protein
MAYLAGASEWSVQLPKLDTALANDLVIALHDAEIQASGPELPAPYGVVHAGGGLGWSRGV